MKQMLIYDGVTPLAKDKHLNYSIKPIPGYDFARGTNSVPVMAGEFALVAMYYAIVFGQANDGVIPAAVLCVRDNENIFVNPDGSWAAAYIPAFIRRYPFVFGTDDKNTTFTLMVDVSCTAFNNAGEGERLFDGITGEQTPFLTGVLDFLSEYQGQSVITQTFCKTLSDFGLLEPAEAHLPLPNDPERRLNGFLMVSRDKLRALPAKKLAELNASGALELIYLHLFSLMNLNRLQQRIAGAAGLTSAA